MCQGPLEQPRLQQKTEGRIFLAILLAFAAMSLGYNVVTPAGEGVDEIPHLRFTLYVKAHHSLPILPFAAQDDTVLMGHHPPLYYVVAALLIAPIDTIDLDATLPPNPHFFWIEGFGPGNRNVFLHSPVTGGDPFPYRGVVLAIHLLRLASTMQGIAMLIVARNLLRQLMGDRYFLVSAACAATAFQPTFLSTFSLAHHDGTVALLTLLGIYWAVRFSAPPAGTKRASSALVGGLILGLDLLVKTNAIVLVPVYLVAMTMTALRARQGWQVLRWGGQIAVIVGMIAGWWYVRNAMLYNDPLAQNVFAATHPELLRRGQYGIGDVVAFFQQLRRTYWGSFGYMHILVDPRVGDTLWIAVAIAIPGFLSTMAARRKNVPFLTAWLICLTAVVALLAVFLRYSFLVGGVGHGRFFVAIFPIVSGLIVLGLANLPPRRWPVFSLTFAAIVVAYGVLAPILVIGPAYRAPVASADSLVGIPQQNVTFGSQLTFVGIALQPSTVPPGSTTEATIFWRRANPIKNDLRFRVRLLARDGATVFDKEYWPTDGGVPTYTWPEGVIYRDTLALAPPSNVAPGIASVRLSVRDSRGTWLDAMNQTEIEIARLAVAAIPTVSTIPSAATGIGAVFEDEVDLVATKLDPNSTAGGLLSTTVYWRGRKALDEDLTVSIQVLSPSGRLVAQHDAEPGGGQAPTSTWVPGQIVADTHEIQLPVDLPSGDYRVIAILYRHPTTTRLILSGRNPPADNVILGNVHVSARSQP